MIKDAATPKQVVLLGATGTIGKAVRTELATRGIGTFCPGRNVTAHDFEGAPVVISCMASRTGLPDDAWAVDHRANLDALNKAKTAGVPHFILLSAICVQKPMLAFQHAKRAFEESLMVSGVTWTIIRPTAYFKSLSGQMKRVQAGKPYLLFGDGMLTSCLPISDRDLARYMVNAIDDPAMQNAILNIGGPGPALTPREMGVLQFELTGRPQRFRHVPVAVMDGVIACLNVAGVFSAKLKAKAELARIGRYYATESMLVWDAAAKRYDAAKTPQFGTDTLRDHYKKMISGEVAADLGDHAVF